MPGFGSGPFGRAPFGEWGWSNNVLFESMPNTYKQADITQGDVLRKYTEGLQPSFDNLRHHIRDFDTLRDPLTVRSDYSEYEYVTLGKQVQPVGNTEQAGALGVVFSPAVFTAQDRTAKFSTGDIGKQIFVRRSNVPANNQQSFTITSVLNDKEVFTDPVIAVDAGPMRWELRSVATLPEGEVEVELRGGDPTRIELGWVFEDGAKQYDVVSRQMYWQPVTANKLLNEREGTGYLGRSSGGSRAAMLYAPSYSFQYADVGKTICIVDESEPRNTGLWEIADVQPIGPGGVGLAMLGVLNVGGLNQNVHGKVEYAVRPEADRRVTIAHVHEQEASLPLAISYDLSVPGRFDITVRLATDGAAEIDTLPSNIASAMALDATVSRYVRAFNPVSGVETEVDTLDRVAIKTCPKADLDLATAPAEVFWSVRPFPRVVLQGGLPLGVVDGEGYDLSVAGVVSPGVSQVDVVSAPFQSGDVGKLLTLRGSSVGDDGCYEILTFVDDSTVLVSGTLEVDAGPLYWAKRTAPRLTTSTTRLNALNYEVQTHASSLLDRLAYDFGIDVDRQQVEVRQRNWVRQVSQWTAIKGTEDSLRAIANLSGFDCDVIPLFTFPAVPGIPLLSGYTAYFIGDGRSAATGSLTVVGAEFAFTDSLLTFSATDVGKVLILSGAATAANNNYFVIKQYVLPDTVYLWPVSVGANLAPITTLVAPDANNGSIQSSVGELYTSVEPRIMRFDDVEVDYLAAICDLPQSYLPNPPGGAARPRHNTTVLDRPGIDVPCEAVPLVVGSTAIIAEAINSGGTDIISAVSSAGTTHTLTVTGDSLSMFLGGDWKLTDFNGNEFYLDSPPVLLAAGAPVVRTAVSMPVDVTNVAAGSGAPPVFRVSAPGHDLLTGDTAIVSGVVFSAGNDPNGTWTVGSTSVDWVELVGSDATGFSYVSGGRLSKQYSVNTYPNAQYQLTLTAASPPAANLVAFTYLCPLELSCDVCPTYRVVVSLTANQILGEGNLANENAFQRCITLLQEAMPVHVAAIYILETPFSTRRMLTGIISETLVLP